MIKRPAIAGSLNALNCELNTLNARLHYLISSQLLVHFITDIANALQQRSLVHQVAGA